VPREDTTEYSVQAGTTGFLPTSNLKLVSSNPSESQWNPHGQQLHMVIDQKSPMTFDQQNKGPCLVVIDRKMIEVKSSGL